MNDKMLENKMLLETAEEPQEPEYDKERDSPDNLNDQLRGVTDCVDELFRIYREQAG